MQKRRNPIADSLVLDVCRFCSCITPSICGNYGFQMNILRYTSSEYHIQDQHLIWINGWYCKTVDIARSNITCHCKQNVNDMGKTLFKLWNKITYNLNIFEHSCL